MDEKTAMLHHDNNGWAVVEEAGRGWRRVVPSPAPIRIVQQEAIMTLAQNGFTVIGVDGGGIPVIEDEKGDLAGVEAVIDKDLASALLASTIHADLFMISTEVEKVALNFNKPDVQWLDSLTLADAKRYMAEGQFGKGSMEPKIMAVLNYLEHGGGRVPSPTAVRALEHAAICSRIQGGRRRRVDGQGSYLTSLRPITRPNIGHGRYIIDRVEAHQQQSAE